MAPVTRLNANGSPDTTFGSGGIVETQIGQSGRSNSVLALQSDGKIVLTGSGALARYASNGQLDDTFGSGGVAATTLADPVVHLEPFLDPMLRLEVQM